MQAKGHLNLENIEIIQQLSSRIEQQNLQTKDIAKIVLETQKTTDKIQSHMREIEESVKQVQTQLKFQRDYSPLQTRTPAKYDVAQSENQNHNDYLEGRSRRSPYNMGLEMPQKEKDQKRATHLSVTNNRGLGYEQTEQSQLALTNKVKIFDQKRMDGNLNEKEESIYRIHSDT